MTLECKSLARSFSLSTEWVLVMMNEHLASVWDVGDDSSPSMAQFRLDPSGSKNRRKRKAPDDVSRRVLTTARVTDDSHQRRQCHRWIAFCREVIVSFSAGHSAHLRPRHHNLLMGLWHRLPAVAGSGPGVY